VEANAASAGPPAERCPTPAPLTSLVAPLGIGVSVSCREVGLRFVAEVPQRNRCQGGWIVENWGQFDTLGLLQQLGIVPLME
jgi:hypothetical protein